MHLTDPKTRPPAGAEGEASDGGLRCRAFWRRMLVAAGLAVLGLLLLAVDLPVARWFRGHRLSGDLGRLVDLSEVFAHGLGVAVILAVTVALDPTLRRAATARSEIVRLVAAAYAGGLVVDVVKLLVTRVRPRAADLAAVASVLGTFGTAAVDGTLKGGGLVGKSSDLMSFPSGHAATAAGLATALCWKYPHGIPVFALLAALAAAQRVVSSAHYPSDTAFGAAVGVAVAAACLACSRPRGEAAG
jgi:membrane-associated phospholipid phosphatase